MSGAHTRANEVHKTIEPVRQPEQKPIRQQAQGPAQAVAPQVAYRRVQRDRNGLRPADLLALQRAVGNRAVQRMVAEADDEPQGETSEEYSERTVQTKLTAGAPDGVQTQGADRAAGQVMTMPAAATQRSNRTGLPDSLKSGVESLSGISMDNVKVHYNSSQPAQLNALAYTQGSDIHVAPGQEQHLPHEAWHVVQQAQGRVRPTMQMKDGVTVNDDQGLEREADVMGARALTNAAQPQGTPEVEERFQGTLVTVLSTDHEHGKARTCQLGSPAQGAALPNTSQRQPGRTSFSFKTGGLETIESARSNHQTIQRNIVMKNVGEDSERTDLSEAALTAEVTATIARGNRKEMNRDINRLNQSLNARIREQARWANDPTHEKYISEGYRIAVEEQLLGRLTAAKAALFPPVPKNQADAKGWVTVKGK